MICYRRAVGSCGDVGVAIPTTPLRRAASKLTLAQLLKKKLLICGDI
jgi:hypothetical protein